MAGQTDSPISGKADLSQLCLGYPDGLSLTEFALCPASKLNSRLHRPPFTAVSMVCVTGLFTQSVASTYNGWGQLICMLLIQIGGLGILTFIGLFFMESRQKLSFKDRQTIRDSFSFSNNQSLTRFVRSIFITTFTIEGLGPYSS